MVKIYRVNIKISTKISKQNKNRRQGDFLMALLDIEKWIDYILKKLTARISGGRVRSLRTKAKRSSLSTRIRRGFPFRGLVASFILS